MATSGENFELMCEGSSLKVDPNPESSLAFHSLHDRAVATADTRTPRKSLCFADRPGKGDVVGSTSLARLIPEIVGHFGANI